MQEAVEEAERRSRIESRLQLLQHQLEYKSGLLPEDMLTVLQAIADVDELDRLGLSLLDALDIQTFRAQIRGGE